MRGPLSGLYAVRLLRGPLALVSLILSACLGALPVMAHADADAGKAKAAVCMACHGPAGNSTNPDYPVLAGQTARYLYLELRDFKAGRRSDPRMSPLAAHLSPDDMHAPADYFAAP